MLLALAAATAVMAPLAVSATARAAPTGPRGSAFVWANKPATASYTPSATYQWNSHHPGAAVNTITRTGKGSYTVRLPGLDAKSGTAIATAYGPNPNYCKVADLRPLHSPIPGRAAQLVDIRCFTVNGVRADTRFTMSYTNPARLASVGYDLAYVLANQPTTGSYAPSLSYQANSSGATNQIHRQGIGSYLVKLPNMGTPGGHVQVTAEGDGSARCKVARWDPNGTEKDIKVACHTPSGKLVNSKFTLTYVRNGNLLGRPVSNHTAYAMANLPGAASYTPEPIRQFTGSPSPITINRLATGSYAVHVPHSLNSGNVQVTAYGDNSAHCKVNFWTAAGIRVLCFNTHGSHVDTRFTVSYVRP